MDYIRQIEDVNNRRMKALRPPHRKEVLKAREDDIKDRVQNWMSREMSHVYKEYQVNYLKNMIVQN